jgi:hypothetical protein
VHVPPSHAPPWLCVVSQPLPHTVQDEFDTGVSHPLVSGVMVLQSA